MEVLNCRRDGPNCFIRFWISAKTKGGRGALGWFYIHVLITTVQLFQKTRRNISYWIKALWNSRKKKKKPQTHKISRRGKQLAGAGWWWYKRKSGVSTEAPQTFQFSKGLTCVETSLHSLPSSGFQESGLEQLVQRQYPQKKPQDHGAQPALLFEHPLFPGLTLGKDSDVGHEKQVKVIGVREKRILTCPLPGRRPESRRRKAWKSVIDQCPHSQRTPCAILAVKRGRREMK